MIWDYSFSAVYHQCVAENRQAEQATDFLN